MGGDHHEHRFVQLGIRGRTVGDHDGPGIEMLLRILFQDLPVLPLKLAADLPHHAHHHQLGPTQRRKPKAGEQSKRFEGRESYFCSTPRSWAGEESVRAFATSRREATPLCSIGLQEVADSRSQSRRRSRASLLELRDSLFDLVSFELHL